jgi:hypothetical protein
MIKAFAASDIRKYRSYIMSRIRKTLSLGCLLAGCAAVSAQNTTTNRVSETTFDANAGSPWSYGYFYANNGLGTYDTQRSFYFPEDTDLTNAVFSHAFDITDLAGTTGWGTGAGAPLFRADTDPALFVSGDRGDYILTFDAKAAGLAEGQTSANGEMQLQFYRKDENGQDQNFLQVNLPFQPTADWKTFSFNLVDGSLGNNSLDADFAAHYTEITDLRFNMNFHEPFNAFGYDADNAVYIDNVKLDVIARPTVTTPGPTFAKSIVDWNMDEKPVWYEYHYDWSQNDNHATFSGANAAGNNAEGVDGSTAWAITLDNSSFVENTPQYAGVGSGGGGPADFTAFDTSDLAAYRVSFAARAAGIDPSATSTAAVLQLFLDAADDAVAADEDTKNDAIGRFDFQVGRLTADWQTYTFKLSLAGATADTKANFAKAFNKIADLRTQWQIENAASAANWGFDADNAVYLDNIKIERIYEGLAPLVFTQEGTELVLSWAAPATGTTVLQAASAVDGPYTDVATTENSYRAPMTDAQKYFRLVWNAPANP